MDACSLSGWAATISFPLEWNLSLLTHHWSMNLSHETLLKSFVCIQTSAYPYHHLDLWKSEAPPLLRSMGKCGLETPPQPPTCNGMPIADREWNGWWKKTGGESLQSAWGNMAHIIWLTILLKWHRRNHGHGTCVRIYASCSLNHLSTYSDPWTCIHNWLSSPPKHVRAHPQVVAISKAVGCSLWLTQTKSNIVNFFG